MVQKPITLNQKRVLVISTHRDPTYRPSGWLVHTGSTRILSITCGCRAYRVTDRAVSAASAAARFSSDTVGNNTGGSTTTPL
jgi:hypothetical protein